MPKIYCEWDICIHCDCNGYCTHPGEINLSGCGPDDVEISEFLECEQFEAERKEETNECKMRKMPTSLEHKHINENTKNGLYLSLLHIERKIKKAIVEIFIVFIKVVISALVSCPIYIWAVPAAYAERGYKAIGGEWLLIIAVFCFTYYAITEYIRKIKKGVGEMSVCGICGSRIRFIRRTGKKALAVNACPLYIIPDDINGKVFVLANGHFRKGTPVPDGLQAFKLHSC